MNVKELEVFKLNKKVKMELQHEDIYNVSITSNGYQWWSVFQGSLGESTIIMKAFIVVGYVKEVSGE